MVRIRREGGREAVMVGFISKLIKKVKKVTFILARKLIAISANVFFPTTILNIISFSTNYYKNDYFESIVGINLTSMLVLTALIVQVLFLLVVICLNILKLVLFCHQY